MSATPDSFLRETLDFQKHAGLSRRLRDLRGAPGPRISLDGRDILLLCSNNYLGLASDERLKQAAREALEKFGCGATGSRLISGNLELYEELEGDLAAFKGAEAALVFPSGYQANVGTIPALAGDDDVIFSDALNHASLIDGCRLSRAETVIYKHCDTADLEAKLRLRPIARRKLIVTESVFSMEGDFAPLQAIASLAQTHGALLMVDEAHATGVFGAGSSGLVEELGIRRQVHVQMGTFSKALGSLGGYIAGSRELISFLIQNARSFIFTTGLPPAVLAASKEALRIVQHEPYRRDALWRNVRQLRRGIVEAGFDVALGQSHILPLQLGDAKLTMAACRFLLRRGIFAQGIRPPTVLSGSARLRLTPMALHSEREMTDAVAALADLRAALNSPKRLGQWKFRPNEIASKSAMATPAQP